VPPQTTPAGDETTSPSPLPVFVIPSAYRLNVNSAVTAVSAAIVTVQVPVPLQPAPLQPANVEPVLGVAVNVTVAPWGYVSEQSAPQLMPAGDDVTVPAPVPLLLTASAKAFRANDAVTAVAAVTVTVQSPVPGQPTPLQLKNAEPTDGTAVSVTIAP